MPNILSSCYRSLAVWRASTTDAAIHSGLDRRTKIGNRLGPRQTSEADSIMRFLNGAD
jgi:hypothetical protein